MNKKVCIYSEPQKSKFAINSQIKILKNFANKNNYENLEVFVDNSVSGLNFDIKGFNELIKLIKSGQMSTLIVKYMPRLGRNCLEVGELTETLFPKYNVQFISVDDKLHSEKDQDGFALYREIINDFYKRLKSSIQKNKLFTK